MTHFRPAMLATLFLAASPFVLSSAASAQSTPDGVARQWMDAFNAGDIAKAGSFNSPAGTSIIDEFAPYAWSGPKAFAEWGAALDADAKAHGLTEPKVELGKLDVRNVTGTNAYLVFPAIYTYKLKGIPTKENAHMAIVMHKESGTWKVLSWSWTGTIPRAVK